jgi:aminotransferase in exopolysaccharide biosynthesis
VFFGNEKEYLIDCIDSTFVSSVGKYVDMFEKMLADYTSSKYAIATVNGTAALHISLLLSEVSEGDEVITQALTFIATANAIKYCNAHPVFLDVDKDTMGLSPESLKQFLEEKTYIKGKTCYNKNTHRRIKACVPMHTFGHPCKIDLIKNLCNQYYISLIEDSAESLGSTYKGMHTGTFGKFGVISFNGNKTITAGGGGMILTNDENLAKRAKHITTTAKLPHKWEFKHDMIGYNYRLTNIAAAIGCAQMENIDFIIEQKRNLARNYHKYFKQFDFVNFILEPNNAISNYWLNTICFESKQTQKDFLEYSNNHGVMTRPVWKLMTNLPIFKDCTHFELTNANWLEERLVNIPSTPIINTN